MTEEEKAVLEQVKRSFPCWQAKQLKKEITKHTNWISVGRKCVLRVSFLALAVFVVGTSIRKAKDASIWYYKNSENQHTENCTLTQ